jgi:DNA-binding MurR/RpiR family transcriptional regulator
VEVAERIRIHSGSLTAAERRVAEAILRSPQSVGFGTVADLADSAKVGAASVVRLATKLGFDGYSDLQASIQHDLMRQLRPAVERIDETVGDGPRSAHAAVELANVRATIEAADSRSIETLAARLADLSRPVVVVSGEASAGVAEQFTDQLEQLREDVRVLRGSDVAVRRAIAVLPANATAIVIDLRRYERWVLDAHTSLRERGVWSAAFTDSILSPLAARADVTFVLSADSVGPFDSHVGTLALLNLIGAEVAGALRSSARDRLAAVEEAWSRHGSLTEST